MDDQECVGILLPEGCRRCGQEKPGTEFRRNRRVSDGLSSWCSLCHNEATRSWLGKRRKETA